MDLRIRSASSGGRLNRITDLISLGPSEICANLLIAERFNEIRRRRKFSVISKLTRGAELHERALYSNAGFEPRAGFKLTVDNISNAPAVLRRRVTNCTTNWTGSGCYAPGKLSPARKQVHFHRPLFLSTFLLLRACPYIRLALVNSNRLG